MIRKLNQIKCYLIGDTKANKGKEVIEELFRKLSTFKSAGPDYSQPGALKELANVIARPSAFILENEVWTGERPDKWNLQMEVFFFLKTKKSTTVVITDYSVYLGYLGRYRNKSSNNQFANI